MKHILLFFIFPLSHFCAMAQWVPLNGPTTHNVLFMDGGRYVFAGTGDGVFRSEDEGLHWEIVPDLPRHYSCYAIAANQDKGQLVAVLRDDACKCFYYYRSNDQGANWKKISTPGFAEYISAVFSGDGGYILTSTSRLQDNQPINTNWESLDGGNSWRRNYMDTLSASPIQSLRLYGTSIWGYSENKLLRGTKQGKDWKLVAITPDSLDIRGYFIAGDTILLNSSASIYSRLWRSVDAGATWLELPFQKSIINFQQYGNTLLALDAYSNIIASQDNGVTWPVISEDSTLLATFLLKGSNLIGYEFGSGVVRSEDLGKHFTRTYERLGSANISDQMAILENQLFVTNAFSGTLEETLPFYDIVHESWGLSTPPSKTHEFSIVTNDIQAFDGRLFACLAGYFTYRSDDKGLSWKACTDLSLWPEVPTGTKFLPMGHSLFLYSHFGNSYYFLNRTDDYGETWINVEYPDFNLCEAGYSDGICLGKSQNSLFAALRYGQCIYKSNDLGNSWESISIPEVPIETDSGLIFIACMATSDKMILLTMGRVERSRRDYFDFVSFDLGTTWIESDAPIGVVETNASILPKIIEFQDLSLLATYSHGVYISQDSGKHWLPFNQGIPSIHVQDIEIDSNNLYVSTWGHGVWKRPLSDLDSYNPAKADSQLNISVGPNPSTGLLRIVSSDPIQSAHFHWFDISGRLCLEQDIEFVCDQSVVELPFQNGVYIYKLTDGNGGRASGKVILLR
ncbi:MAG: T9SS type A sorting domain-containing protein [Phycisphaerae bacterium]|nr:T9SS type A sorting domain-containing protein [Saprospiraceae bacterium]